MDAAAFLDCHRTGGVKRPAIAEWLAAIAKLVVGAVLLRDVFGLFSDPSPLLLGWSGMIGIMLILHFGLFQLLSCFWRANGVDARPLMNQPVRSTSLAELWGQRWNIAFRDLLHRFLFAPLSARVGPRGATWIGFAISGVIHDVVMSLPAQGGYGKPTLYFLIQAAGLLAERSRRGRRCGLGHGVRGWLFTMCVLIGPSPLLLHRPFIEQIVVPFVLAVRSL
jgi:alginate O-acetyltransferase complex protein AlgI